MRKKILTVQQLKDLALFDWIWVIDYYNGCHQYEQKFNTPGINHNEEFDCQSVFKYMYKDYGIKWIAYKNKEGAKNAKFLQRKL